MLSENEKYQPSFKKIRRLDVEPTRLQQQSILTEILISDFELSKKQIGEVISAYAYDYIIEKVKLVKAKKNIDHTGAYLLSALKKDYKQREHILTPKKQMGGVENSYLRQAKEASEILSLKNKYMMYKLKMYMTFIQQQTDHSQAAIREKFEQFIQPNVEVFRFYRKTGLSSPFVMSDFMRFIEKHCPHIIGDYLSFDDYITSEEV